MSAQVVAIVGRPNVGKSTLFNRLTGQRVAIEDSHSGITRDRIYGQAEWQNREFTVIDTGGLTFDDDFSIESMVHRQVELAIEEASLVLLVVDAAEGLTVLDYDIANYLRRTGKNVLVVANKVDRKSDWDPYSLYELGLGEPIAVSSSHGMGTGDLLDHVVEELAVPERGDEDQYEDYVKVAVVGRPNVGKSSLVNRLLGKERVIVSEEPGTTRDAIDVPVEQKGCKMLLMDTAGLRRRSKVKEDVEYYSVVRALKAARRAEVVLVMLDAVEGFTEQDQKIAGIAHEAGKGLIFVVNKWDLVSSTEKETRDFRERVREEFAFASYAPVLLISAFTGRGVDKIGDLVVKVDAESKKRLPTALLNDLLQDALLVNPPPSKKGKKPRIFYVTQPHVQPPTFVFFANDPGLVHFSYVRYLENRLREAFGFEGVPLRLKVKPKKEPDTSRTRVVKK